MTSSTTRRKPKQNAPAPEASTAAEEFKPPVAKVYITFAWTKTDGTSGFGWKIIEGMYDIRNAATLGNTMAFVLDDGGYSDVTIINWKSLEN